MMKGKMKGKIANRKTLSITLISLLIISAMLGVMVNAAAITIADITPASSIAGATTDYSLGFTPTTAEVADVIIDFSAFGTEATDMDLSAVSTTIADYIFGGFTADPTAVTVNDVTKIITFTGGTVAVALQTIDNAVAETGLVITNDQDAEAQLVTISTVTDTGTFSLTIDPDETHHFLVVTENTGIEVAGTAFLVTITAKDQFENTADDYDGAHTITFTSTATASRDGDAPTIQAPESLTFSSGVITSTVDGFTLTRVGEKPTITATDGTISGTSDPIFVEGLALDSTFYRRNEIVTVTVADHSAGLPDTTIMTESAEVVGDIDTLTLALTETGVDTGVFTGTFKLVSVSPGFEELLVTPTDTFTVTSDTGGFSDGAAIDETPPDPPTDLVATAIIDGAISLTWTDSISGDVDHYAIYRSTIETFTPSIVNLEGTALIAAETYVDDDTDLVDGVTYYYKVGAVDAGGNEAYSEVEDAISDSTLPTLTIDVDSIVIHESITIGIVSDEELQEAATVLVTDPEEVELDVTSSASVVTANLAWNYGFTVSLDGIYTINATGTDLAGNEGTASTTFEGVTDTTDPIIVDALVDYPAGGISARVDDTVVVIAIVTDDLSGVETVIINATEIGLTASETMTLTTETDVWMAELVVGTVDADIYNLTITATDFADNENSSIVQVQVTVTLTAYNIELYEGWNLISLPLVPEDSTIDVVLADVLENVEQVYYYETETWSYYLTAAPEFATLSEIEDGKGYWVKMTADDTLIVYGTEQPIPPGSPRIYPVYEGWNLIGFKSTDVMTVSYLTTIPLESKTYMVIYGWDSTLQCYELVSAGMPEIVDPLFNPGQGYWLYLIDEAEIVPPTG